MLEKFQTNPSQSYEKNHLQSSQFFSTHFYWLCNIFIFQQLFLFISLVGENICATVCVRVHLSGTKIRLSFRVSLHFLHYICIILQHKVPKQTHRSSLNASIFSHFFSGAWWFYDICKANIIHISPILFPRSSGFWTFFSLQKQLSEQPEKDTHICIRIRESNRQIQGNSLWETISFHQMPTKLG